MTLPAGARVGPYEVVSLLGTGGMGEVYRARDVNLHRDVAIKILPEMFAAVPERVARFEREARLLATLNHPHIATIHGVEIAAAETAAGPISMYALVLEVVEGHTLADAIRGGPLPIREALTIARSIADALEAAHDKGIIHRDLKPANIKITPAGIVKVLDFGLAKASSDDTPDASQLATIGATREGVILGTAAYMSPEQARGKPVDKRTDIWAFGCVLYEMLTGRVAFSGGTVPDLIAAVLEREPDWTTLPGAAPDALSQLLRRCFEKDPHRRLRDIGDARLAIEDVLANRDGDQARTARPTPGRFVAAMAVAAAAGLALGAIGMRLLATRNAADRFQSRQVRFAIPLPADTIINPTQNRQEAISPDGALIAYVGLRNGQRTLYLRRVDELDAKPLEGIGAATGPFFSPDGKWLGFTRSAGGGVMKIALSGGAPVTIARPGGVQGASWSEDGTIVFINGSLYRVPPSGGPPIEAAKPDTAHGERWFRAPQFLPGGKTVLLTVSNEDTGSFDDARIVALNLETGDKKTLIEGGMSARYSPSGHLVYARSGALLAVPFDVKALRVTGPPFQVLTGVFMSINSGFAEFDVGGDGTLIYSPGEVEGGERLPVWVDRQGNAAPLPLPPRSYLHPRLSPDERQLAIEIEGATHDLYTYDFARGTLTRVTLDGMSHWPLWTPAGDRLTFRSFRTNSFTMWSMPADRSGGAEERLTRSDKSESAGSWSPDGKAMAFTQSNADSGSDVYVLRVDEGGTLVPLANSKFAEGSPKFSPDGRWVAYSSTESGRAEIYAQSWPPGGPKMQISTEGGTDPLWSRDSGELFYRNGDKMMATNVTFGQKLIVSKPALLWTGHYAAGMSSSCGVPGPTSANYDVTADGKRFLMIRDKDQDLVGRQLNVFVNWTPPLPR